MTSYTPKLLFFAEGATLAHVARPFVLARGLPLDRFKVTFARPRDFAWLTADASFAVTDLQSQDGEVFARRLARGTPLYDFQTLLRYVYEDLALIDREQPNLIIGDFRLSLSVSARLRSIPYITICDAYWSPELPLQPPLPVLGFTRFTPIPIAEFIFRCVSGPALRLHSIPIERLRRHFDLPSLGFDLRRCYTDADLRLFANFAALFPEVRTGFEAEFIGPVAWSPRPTKDLNFLDQTGPLAYVTMGSSGDTRVLANLVAVLEEQFHRIVIASAGKELPDGIRSDKTQVFEYLPGNQVCRQASLVVCNGGSPTTNQALASGVPVLGIPNNMDQFLNMRAIVQFGAGALVRADRSDTTALRHAITRLTTEDRFANRASTLAESTHVTDIDTAFVRNIDRLLSTSTSSNL